MGMSDISAAIYYSYVMLSVLHSHYPVCHLMTCRLPCVQQHCTICGISCRVIHSMFCLLHYSCIQTFNIPKCSPVTAQAARKLLHICQLWLASRHLICLEVLDLKQGVYSLSGISKQTERLFLLFAAATPIAFSRLRVSAMPLVRREILKIACFCNYVKAIYIAYIRLSQQSFWSMREINLE